MGKLPKGFKVGTSWFSFMPVEANFPSRMNVTLITLDVSRTRFSRAVRAAPSKPYTPREEDLWSPFPHACGQKPTDKFAAVFTKNAFPGAPIRVGRKRVQEKYLQAIVVNNKVLDPALGSQQSSRSHADDEVCGGRLSLLWRFQISNVSPGGGLADGGVDDAEKVCAAVAKELGLPSASYVLPSSTGVIGWRLPFQSIIDSIVRCPCPGLPCLFRTLAGGDVAQSHPSTHAAYAEYPAACPCLAACPAERGEDAAVVEHRACRQGHRHDRPLPQDPVGHGGGRHGGRHREGRRHDRAQPRHHAGLHPDRHRRAEGHAAKVAERVRRAELQLHQRGQRHEHVGHRGAGVVG